MVVDLRIDPLVPTSSKPSQRYLRLLASDLSAQVDVLETVKDNLRATVSVMDVRFEDVTKQTGGVQPVVVLARTMPRNLVRFAPLPVSRSLTSVLTVNTHRPLHRRRSSTSSSPARASKNRASRSPRCSSH